MKKVLLLTDVNFWEQSSGNRSRIYSLVKYLAGIVNLTVVNTGPAPAYITGKLAADFNAEFFVLENTKYLSSNGYGRKLKALLKDRHFDSIIIEYIHSSYFLNFLEGEPTLILDAHDIISDRAEEFKKFGHSGELYELTGEVEKEIFGVYDHIMALCQTDYDKVTTMAGPGKALLCPHPVESVNHPIRGSVKNIVFVASSYLPNRDAIQWFIKNCWPQISAKSDVRLQIYGTVCNSTGWPDDKNIILNGFVNSIEDIYDRADIVINPVRFGAGVKIKNIEALAHGRPLITTPHGARGIESGVSVALLVADDADGFINCLNLLMTGPAKRKAMSKAAIHFVRENLSPHMCFGPLINKIDEKS